MDRKYHLGHFISGSDTAEVGSALDAPASRPTGDHLEQGLGRRAHWLRARWAQGTYLRPPVLERVSTNTIWGRHQTTIEGEVLDVAMAAYVVAVRRAVLGSLRPGELRRPNEWLGAVEE